ncbi:MAG: hypothetical protein HWE12_11440 [Oceanospirillaceae bacterium]|nr:hypothetical protein [Oceanospirillaceae bacterium]
MENSNCRIVGLPFVSEMRDDSVFKSTDRLLQVFFDNSSEVLAIYEYGSRTHPHISDIDLILVCSNKIVEREIFESSLSSLKDSLDGIGARNDASIMVMSKDFFSNLLYVDKPTTSLLFGDDLEQVVFNEDILRFRDLTNIIEWIAWNHYKYKHMLKCDSVDAGPALRFLKCMGYSLDSAINALGYSEKSYVSKSKSFRDACVLGLKTNQDLSDELSIYFENLMRIGEELSPIYIKLCCEFSYRDISHPIEFLESISPASVDSFDLPLIYFMTWNIYAEREGHVAEKIRHSLGKSRARVPNANSHYMAYLERRFSLIQSHITYLNENVSTGSAFKLGWFR